MQGLIFGVHFDLLQIVLSVQLPRSANWMIIMMLIMMIIRMIYDGDDYEIPSRTLMSCCGVHLHLSLFLVITVARFAIEYHKQSHQ